MLTVKLHCWKVHLFILKREHESENNVVVVGILVFNEGSHPCKLSLSGDRLDNRFP